MTLSSALKLIEPPAFPDPPSPSESKSDAASSSCTIDFCFGVFLKRLNILKVNLVLFLSFDAPVSDVSSVPALAVGLEVSFSSVISEFETSSRRTPALSMSSRRTMHRVGSVKEANELSLRESLVFERQTVEIKAEYTGQSKRKRCLSSAWRTME
mgnify:CR=1 FL=1